MHAETDLAEQRRSTRYRVGGNAYALLKQPQYKELGKIIDISQTGISFLCINQGDWDETPFAIDIFLGQEQDSVHSDQIVLHDLPLQPLRYCRKNHQDGGEGGGMMLRCGVEFGRLNPDQQARLELFILRHGYANA
jgi:hypothetical protein